MFTLNKKLIVLELREEQDTVDIYANGECIAYFDDDGLNLLPGNEHCPELPVDELGYLKTRKAL